MKTFGILNGPNLNWLGKREPHIYGSQTLADLESILRAEAAKLGVAVECFQSNHEGELVDKIYALAQSGASGIILNAGALTHTSIALRDAVAGVGIPTIEVHISNVYKREDFRHHSYTAPVARGVIAGLGLEGYLAALRFLAGNA